MSENKPDRKSIRIKTWLREPLVHFLAIGALIFLSFHLWSGGGPGTNRIVITPGQVESMTARFLRTWQRPPSDAELKGLIDDHVRGVMAAREAMSLGLDQDDTIIQRRLRQKLEFLAEDMNFASPTEAELRDWLDRHPETFRIETRLAFRQVYLNPEKHGTALEQDAQALLSRLSAAGPEADIGNLGDALILPRQLQLTAESGISSMFGQEFAESLLSLETGRWTGPVHSGFGLHLVYIAQRESSRIPELSEVRMAVEREFLADRRKQALEAMYQGLLERYQVTIETEGNGGASAMAATEPPAGEKL
jgi:hypothetical protein